MSDYGQSLEEMLAELEGPSSGGGGGGGDDYDDLEDIEGFLSKLENESKSKPPTVSGSNYQQPKPAPVQQPKPAPVQQQPTKSVAPVQQPKAAPVQHQPVQQQSKPAPVQPQPVQHQHVQQQKHQSYSQSASSGDSVGEKLLQAENFVKHNNRGKFVRYQNGKATDFRIKGTTSSKVGLLHVITLRALDDYGNLAPITEVPPKDFIACILTHRETSKDIQAWIRDNNDGTYDLAFYNEIPGNVRMEIKLCGNPMFDLDIQVDGSGDSIWVALGNATCEPNETYRIDIVTTDGSRPEGVAPFEVQTMGDISDLKLVNNGDGTYYVECCPHSNGSHVTVQICLHGEPIKNSPLTVQVGEKQKYQTKQTAQPTPKPQATTYHAQPVQSKPVQQTYQPPPQQQPVHHQSVHHQSTSSYQPAPQRQSYTQQPQQAVTSYNTSPKMDDTFNLNTYDAYGNVGGNNLEVTNDDLNALLDELGGF